MKTLHIRNGRVIDPASQFDGVTDIWIVEGKISRERPSGDGWDVFDAAGMVVAPGFIDMHVHLREPGLEHAETIESGSRAAAAGGFTTICCMPNTKPVNDSATVTSYIIERARRAAVVNVLPIGAITKGSAGEELAAIGSMKKAGIVAISDDGRPVMNSRVMRRAMEFARSLDLPVIDHCEDLNLSAGGDMHEGVVSTRLGLRGIPSSSEDVMVARDILLADATGARFHVAHISTRHSVAMVAFAKSKGLPVTCETTPHHFALTDAGVAAYDSNYKMKPPLRCDHDVDAVIEGIVSGAIDVIATDHAPHAGSEKMQEFERCPFGITGLETAIGLTTGTAGAYRQNLPPTHGGTVHHRSGAGAAARPGNPGARRAGRCDHLRSGAGVDLRRQSFILEEPELAVRRTPISRGPGGCDRQWSDRLVPSEPGNFGVNG